MPFPYTIASQAIPSVNTTNQLTLDKNTPDVQAQSTISGGRTVNTIAVENKISFSCYYCNAIFPIKSYATHHIAMSHRKQVDEVMMHNKRLIDSFITDMQSKISDPVALKLYIRLLNKIKSISFTRICRIFNDHIPVDKPRGLGVFLNKLTLFIDAMPKTEYYTDNKKYKLDSLLSYCFIQRHDSSLKIENIQSFMRLTDEQIIKDAQDKELFISIFRGDYPNIFSQNTIDQMLNDNLPTTRYAEIESIYPQFSDEFKRVCKNKKLFIHYTFVNIIKKLLSNQDLPAKNILHRILYFLDCIDDNSPYIDTSIIYKLFGFSSSISRCKLIAILELSPQILEQIAKNPQLIQHAQQCKDGVFSLTRQQLEDKNIIIKVQADHNANVDQCLPESVIAESLEFVVEEQPVCNIEKLGAAVEIVKSQTANNINAAKPPQKSVVIVVNPVSVVTGQQIRNIENLEDSIESELSHNLTITTQIEKVINNCHQDKANILDDLNATICSTCIQKNISMKDGLLDIFRTLSKKYISCKDAESISNQLRAVVKNLPDNIKIENTSFLNNICNNETGYINGLLALKELSVDEITETIKKKVDGLEPSVEKDDLISSKDIESSNTTELTSDTPTNKKRNLDDYDTSLNNKRFKTGE
jgi:mRNA-degrading endonuclease YafQ of YafQ-DinJ toxin-antitoxin module